MIPKKRVLTEKVQSSTQLSRFDADRLSNEDAIECVHYVIHMLSTCQKLCGQIVDVASFLNQEITGITQGRAHLYIPNKKQLLPTEYSTVASFQVHFGKRFYGTLYIEADPEQPMYPSLSIPLAHLLAQICGWLLYTFEHVTLLQLQCQRLDLLSPEPLTEREHEVLKLIGCGFSQKEIAKTLKISPATVSKHRQHIYEQLHVHNKQDALLVAYQTGLLSFISNIKHP